MSQVIQQEALTRLLIEKGIFTKDEFMEMVRLVDQGKGRRGRSCRACLKPVLIAGRNRPDELDVVGGRDSLS